MNFSCRTQTECITNALNNSQNGIYGDNDDEYK